MYLYHLTYHNCPKYSQHTLNQWKILHYHEMFYVLYTFLSLDFTIKLQRALIKFTTLMKYPLLHAFISYKPLQCTQGTSNVLLVSEDRFVKMIPCQIRACTPMRREALTYVPTIQRCSRPVSTHSLTKIYSIHPYYCIHHQK